MEKDADGFGVEKKAYMVSYGQTKLYTIPKFTTTSSIPSLCFLKPNPLLVREELMDIYNLDAILLKERKRLESLPDFEIITRFLWRMEVSGIGKVQLIKYCQGIRNFSLIQSSLASATQEDLEKFLISMKGLKPKTQKIRWYAIKKFFDFIGHGEIFNDFTVRFEKSRTKLPEEILTKEEIMDMIATCTNFRNAVFISTLYESGTRISELLTSKVSNLIFDAKGCMLMVDGKTGQRSVRLIRAVQLLKQYIQGMPREAMLFPISYANCRKILNHAAKKANIEKKIHPHIFRHSRATHLANILTEAQMNAFFGWTQGSSMARIYVHLSGKDIDDALLREQEPSIEQHP